MDRRCDARAGASELIARLLRTVAVFAGVALLVFGAVGCRDATPSPEATTATSSPTAPATGTAVGSSMPEPRVTPIADGITIAVVGDLMFARDVTDLMTERGVGYPFARVRALFGGADLVVGNLEGTFTDRGVPLEKVYTFRTPPGLAGTLREAGFHAVTLANNHAYDFGEEGLADTLGAVRATGVAAFGAGLDEPAARAPAILEAGGFRVALLGYDDIGEVRLAAGAEPGVARADEALIAADVAAAADAADFVLVFVHWGVEYSHAPTDRQRALAHAAVNAGASAVIGSHPHALQPWERVGNAVVLFSLGNFVFDLDPDDLATLGPPPFQSVVALITLSRAGPPTVTWRPVTIDEHENRPRPATEPEGTAILALLGDGTSASGSR